MHNRYFLIFWNLHKSTPLVLGLGDKIEYITMFDDSKINYLPPKNHLAFQFYSPTNSGYVTCGGNLSDMYPNIMRWWPGSMSQFRGEWLLFFQWEWHQPSWWALTGTANELHHLGRKWARPGWFRDRPSSLVCVCVCVCVCVRAPVCARACLYVCARVCVWGDRGG